MIAKVSIAALDNFFLDLCFMPPPNLISAKTVGGGLGAHLLRTYRSVRIYFSVSDLHLLLYISSNLCSLSNKNILSAY